MNHRLVPEPVRYLVLDLEATTCRNGSIPKDERETIEIGAVLVRSGTLEAESEFSTFVRPVRHPTLSTFCTELTGITQAMLVEAPGFPQALTALGRELPLSSAEVRFCSWGEFDRRQLERDCAYHGVVYPFPPHLDLKERFARVLRSRRRFGVAEALGVCGLEFAGTAHRALDDARNIARLLPWVIGERPVAPARGGAPDQNG